MLRGTSFVWFRAMKLSFCCIENYLSIQTKQCLPHIPISAVTISCWKPGPYNISGIVRRYSVHRLFSRLLVTMVICCVENLSGQQLGDVAIEENP